MEKIKLSTLLSEMIVNSQLAFIDEDPKIQKMLHKIITSSQTIDYFTVAEMINANNEYLRISLIKALLKTLEQHDLVEKDIDLFNSAETNYILATSVEHAISKNKID